ncbi:MAG: hypothetical protein HRT73_07630 [Flavobacteriales bacterium]|nr:hypothetical protein [Flavobacteriales bacterium]
MNVHELHSVTISLDKERVLLIKYKDGVYVDIDEAEKIMEATVEIVGKTNFYLIVDARDILSSLDHNSRKFMSEHEVNEFNIAQAIIVNNMPIRLLANFYLKFYKHNNPIRVFTDIDEGRKWVLSQG